MRWLGAALIGLTLVGCADDGPAPVVYGTKSGQTVSRPDPGTVVVRSGDTLYAIARAYGYQPSDLIKANRLSPPFTIKPGQKIRIPRPKLHKVAAGDTLYGISRRYGISVTELARTNRLSSPYLISKGQELRVPGHQTGATAPKKAVAVKTAPTTPKATGQPSARPKPKRIAAIDGPRPRPKPVKTGGRRFIKPVDGKVISNFGPKKTGLHNDGVNFAVPWGSPVKVAEGGTVVYAGDELRGYGNLVLVRHGGGWTTAYAHNSKLLVARGDQVQRGQVIAKSGSTGSVRSPQLHFELRKGKRALNPLRYL